MAEQEVHPSQIPGYGWTETPNAPGGDTLYTPCFSNGEPINDEIGGELNFYSQEECEDFLEIFRPANK